MLIALGLAYRANWIAQNTAERQLRAYLNARSAEAHLSNIKHGRDLQMIHYGASVVIRNAGQTPAKITQMYAFAELYTVQGTFLVGAGTTRGERVVGPQSEYIARDVGAGGTAGKILIPGNEAKLTYWLVFTYEDFAGVEHFEVSNWRSPIFKLPNARAKPFSVPLEPVLQSDSPIPGLEGMVAAPEVAAMIARHTKQQ